jgi:hypothetical protein
MLRGTQKATANIKCKFCNDTGAIVIASRTVWKPKRMSITTGPSPLKSFCAHCELDAGSTANGTYRSQNRSNRLEQSGRRTAKRRMMLGMTQQTLAEAFGLTFQQVQRYAKGVNRMGAGRGAGD